MVNFLLINEKPIYFPIGSKGMNKLIQECQNPKMKDYKLPKSWKCDPQIVIRLNFSAINLDDIDSMVKKQIINCLYTTAQQKETEMFAIKTTFQISSCWLTNMTRH